MPGTNGIGTLKERSLHAELKAWFAQPGDALEQQVAGYQIDIVRKDLLIEIQMGNFSAIKSKLANLLEEHHVLLVHPIAVHKWILRQNKHGRRVARRKSPRRGRLEHLFEELVRLPELAAHPNLSLDLPLIHMEEIWRDDGKGSWRRGRWSIYDRRLLEVVSIRRLANRHDYLALLPESLPAPFTNPQLAQALGISKHLAGKMTYSLRKMGCLDVVGKQGRAFLFDRVQLSSQA